MINLIYQHQHRMRNLIYQMDLILYQIFKIKKHEKNINEPSIQIYFNKIENRITFKIKNGYSLELLTKETMKLLVGVLKIK